MAPLVNYGSDEEKDDSVIKPVPISCHVCMNQSAKYTCPRCQTKSCSLACSQKHKTLKTLKTWLDQHHLPNTAVDQDSYCDGKRCRVEWTPLAKYDAKTFYNDYRLLEEVAQAADRASRINRMDAKESEKGVANHSRKWLNLVDAAKRRGTQVKLLSEGMSRRKQNQTRIKNQEIYWTVEFKILLPLKEAPVSEPDSIAQHLQLSCCKIMLEHDFSEQLSLENLWLNLTPKIEPHLRVLVQKRSFHFYAACLNQPVTNPAFWQLDSRISLKDALNGTQFYEFPTIYLIESSIVLPRILPLTSRLIKREKEADLDDLKTGKRFKIESPEDGMEESDQNEADSSKSVEIIANHALIVEAMFKDLCE